MRRNEWQHKRGPPRRVTERGPKVTKATLNRCRRQMTTRLSQPRRSPGRSSTSTPGRWTTPSRCPASCRTATRAHAVEKGVKLGSSLEFDHVAIRISHVGVGDPWLVLTAAEQRASGRLHLGDSRVEVTAVLQVEPEVRNAGVDSGHVRFGRILVQRNRVSAQDGLATLDRALGTAKAMPGAGTESEAIVALAEVFLRVV